MRKQTRRKVYALTCPITLAIEGASITDDSRLKQLSDNELKAIQDMTTGKGDLYTWQNLVDMNNLCQIMGRQGIGPECLVDTMLAEIELKAAAKRYEKTKKMGLTALGIKSIKQVHEWHDLQRKSISRGEYERMIQLTLNKIKSKSKDVQVLG
jgi:hypothetical protein